METVYHKEPYILSTDKSRLDVALIHQFLSGESYWAANIPKATVEKAIAHSLCFGVYMTDTPASQPSQVGFARMITDEATFAYLADVFILPAHRGKGLSKWMMECILAHPDLQGLRRMMLGTLDAHRLYAQFGFEPLDKPERIMQIHHPEVYGSPAQ